MADLREVLNEIKGWGSSWKARAQAAEAQNETLSAGLTAAQEALADKAAELQKVLDDDASEDALQITQAKADQAKEDADAAQAVLDEVKADDLPPVEDEPPTTTPDGGDDTDVPADSGSNLPDPTAPPEVSIPSPAGPTPVDLSTPPLVDPPANVPVPDESGVPPVIPASPTPVVDPATGEVEPSVDTATGEPLDPGTPVNEPLDPTTVPVEEGGTPVEDTTQGEVVSVDPTQDDVHVDPTTGGLTTTTPDEIVDVPEDDAEVGAIPAAPVPVNPDAEPVMAGELDPATPVVEVPSGDGPVEVPEDAVVTTAGSLPEDAIVTPVTDPTQ